MADATRIGIGPPFQTKWDQGSASNFTLNQTTDALAVIFQAPAALTLTRIGVRLSGITGTTPTYRASLQGVTLATGRADGTVKGGGSPASKTFSPSGLGWSAGDWRWLTLDNSYTTTRGEWLAWVIDYSSGTVDGSNNAAFSYTFELQNNNLPYGYTVDAGSASTYLGCPVFGYATAGTAYGCPMKTHQDIFSDATNEYGIKFSLPAGWGTSFKVLGVRTTAGNAGFGAGTWDVNLYDGGLVTDTTILQSVSYNQNESANPANFRGTDVLWDESTLSTLTFGNTYRIGFKYSAGSSPRIYGQAFDVDVASDLDAYPLGQAASYSTRAGGNWTDTATRRPIFELILDDITPPAGGGGPGSCHIVGGNNGPVVTE